mgnify:CR=1 FL=1
MNNFLKQIFEDEIQDEQEQLVRLRNEQAYQEPSAYDDVLNEEVLDIDALSGEMVAASLEGAPVVEGAPELGGSPFHRTPTPSGRFTQGTTELTVRFSQKEMTLLFL